MVYGNKDRRSRFEVKRWRKRKLLQQPLPTNQVEQFYCHSLWDKRKEVLYPISIAMEAWAASCFGVIPWEKPIMKLYDHMPRFFLISFLFLFLVCFVLLNAGLQFNFIKYTLCNVSYHGSCKAVSQASSSGGTKATCGTSEPLKTKKIKGNFVTFGTVWHFGHVIENPCCKL